MKLKKSSEVLNLYVERLSIGLEKKLSPASFEISSSFRSPKIVFITGYIVFRNGFILEFDEVLEQTGNQAEKIKYRYHVMNKNKQLIFRYDNVAHFTKIKSFPHHKHLSNAVIDSPNPDLFEVIKEIESLLIKERC